MAFLLSAMKSSLISLTLLKELKETIFFFFTFPNSKKSPYATPWTQLTCTRSY